MQSSSVESLPMTLSTDMCAFIETLKGNRERFKSYSDPISLKLFFLQAIQDPKWVIKESDFVKRIFTDLTNFALEGRFPLEDVLKVIDVVIRFSPGLLPYVFNYDLEIKDGDKVVKISKIIWIRQSRNFKEKDKTHYNIGEFSPFLNIDLVRTLNYTLETDDYNEVKSQPLNVLWTFIKQCHLWGMKKVIEALENGIIKYIKDPISALESFHGTFLYDLALIKNHCLQLLNGNLASIYLTKNNILLASLYRSAPLNIFEGIHEDVTRLNLHESLIKNTEWQKKFKEIPKLECIKLSLSTSNEIRSLKVSFLEMNSEQIKEEKKRVERFIEVGGERVEDQAIVLEAIEQLDISTGNDSKTAQRICLGLLIKLEHIKDLRLSPHIETPFFKKIMQLKPHLLRLNLEFCSTLGDDSWKLIPEGFPELNVLNVKGVKFSTATFQTLILGLKHLVDLNISDCPGIKRGTLLPVKDVFRRLKAFKGSSLKHLKKEDLLSLFDQENQLEFLDMSHTEAFQMGIFNSKLPFLKTLIVSSEAFDEKWEINFPRHLKKLDVIGQTPLTFRNRLAAALTHH